MCNHPLREDARRCVGQTLSWCELLSQRLTHSSVEVLTQHFFLLPYLPFPKMQLLNINMKNKYLADKIEQSFQNAAHCYGKLLLQFSFNTSSSHAAISVKFVSGHREHGPGFFEKYVFTTVIKLLFCLPVVNSQTSNNLLKPLVLALLCS